MGFGQLQWAPSANRPLMHWNFLHVQNPMSTLEKLTLFTETVCIYMSNAKQTYKNNRLIKLHRSMRILAHWHQNPHCCHRVAPQGKHRKYFCVSSIWASEQQPSSSVFSVFSSFKQQTVLLSLSDRNLVLWFYFLIYWFTLFGEIDIGFIFSHRLDQM